MKLTKLATGLLLATSLLSACSENNNTQNPAPTLLVEAQSRLDIYKPVTLTADLSHLSENQKQMIVLLIEASDIIETDNINIMLAAYTYYFNFNITFIEETRYIKNWGLKL